jgi:hypothetical protein
MTPSPEAYSIPPWIKFPHHYTLCPECGNYKHKQSKNCFGCAFSRPVIVQPEDQSIRHIALTQGKVAVVDVADYERLNQFRWAAHWDKKLGSYYADRGVYVDGKRYTVKMHREILGLERGDKTQADHKNHDTLDNRRLNLRKASHAQNAQNHRLRRDNKSGYSGVWFEEEMDAYRAYITVNKEHLFLGYRRTAKAAYALVREAALKRCGEFANVKL